MPPGLQVQETTSTPKGVSRTKQREGSRVGSCLANPPISCVVLEFPNPEIGFLIVLTGVLTQGYLAVENEMRELQYLQHRDL